ncbi:hypothetical protein FI667_g9358, partial [Globisporangium splendens]
MHGALTRANSMMKLKTRLLPCPSHCRHRHSVDTAARMNDQKALAQQQQHCVESGGAAVSCAAGAEEDAEAAAALQELLHELPSADLMIAGDELKTNMAMDETFMPVTAEEGGKQSCNSVDDPLFTHDAEALVVLSPEEHDVLLSVLQEEEGESSSEDEKSRVNTATLAQSASANGTIAAESLATVEVQTSKGSSSQQSQAQKVVVKRSRRNRKRRKHEVDALRVTVKELADKLEWLRRQGDAFALSVSRNALPGQPTLLPAIDRSKFPIAALKPPGVWESIALSEREQARGAMIKNMHLRAQYEAQLQVVDHLEALYRNHQMVSAMSPPLGGYDIVSKRPRRTDPFDDDTAIFASLGRDFDAQYAKSDSILAAAGLANFDGELLREMQPRRGTNGIFFLENVISKVIPADIFVTDRAISEFVTREELHRHHKIYEVREMRNDGNVRKIVDTIRLPHSEATLIVRTSLKRYKEAHRIVVVWDAVLEVTGSTSMRFRERGWKVKRRSLDPSSARSGPTSIEQTCVRITPELRGAYSEQDLATGTLANVLIASYHEHTKLMHRVNMNRLVTQFEKCTI